MERAGRLARAEDALRGRAADLAERDGLRGYDAVHLAAALAVHADAMASGDRRLCAAAAEHGLHVANVATS